MSQLSASCDDPRRRHAARDSRWNGVDYLEVSDDQLVLTVFFLNRKPEQVHRENVRIDGGVRIRDIRVVDVHLSRPGDPGISDSMTVTVDRPGDYSTYTLTLIEIDGQRRPTGRPLPGFDPRYASVEFTFKVSCPTDADCGVDVSCPAAPPVEPEITYLAKDYASFRQIMLNRLSLILPDWTERHVPDLGMALVEVMAYVGDHLSYYQDAVATEAYLHTARKRISIRRHARLVDYTLHEGCNARVWISLKTDGDLAVEPADMFFTTSPASLPPDVTTLDSQALDRLPADSYEVFQPLAQGTISLVQALNDIHIYTWGDRECWLPRGATSATLIDEWEPLPPKPTPPEYQQETVAQDRPRRLRRLQRGQYLLFEEVIGPITGQAADADPRHRQVVRLTRVTPAVDELFDQPVVNIEWSPADALEFQLCLSGIGNPPTCEFLKHISVARGNIVLADHGRTVVEDLPDVTTTAQEPVCEGRHRLANTVPSQARYRADLKEGPLTQSQRLGEGLPASASITQDERLAWPAIRVADTTLLPETRTAAFANADTAPVSRTGALRLVVGPTPYDITLDRAHNTLNGARAAINGLKAGVTAEVVHHRAGWLLLILTDDRQPTTLELYDGEVEISSRDHSLWEPRPDLLASSSRDRHFVVEIDDEARAHLRFGDGDFGKAPSAVDILQAEYRIGNGPAGNVGAESISMIVFRRNTVTGDGLRARNPMPAIGGTVAESTRAARMNAPQAFRATLSRAITAADYARLAERHPGVQRAAATLTWTGSWHEVEVAIDPLGREDPDSTLLEEVERELHKYKRLGHDLIVSRAQYVALDIGLDVCVLPQFVRAQVKAALQARFAALFDPDNLTFGGRIAKSRLVAAAQSVPGVQNVTVTRLVRFGMDDNGELQSGVLSLGPGEIARVDNDPSFPERGRITLQLRGGR